ncbi:MAG: hypothetical protein ACK5MI_04615 [Mangrovibacterium sp.]
MKKVLLSLALLFGICLLNNTTASAGVISTSKDIIGVVNNFNGSDYGLNSQESQEVKDANSSLVNGAFKIINGNDSKHEKRKSLKKLKKETQKKYKKIFKGKKGPIKKFKKDLKKKTRPFRRKVKLIGLIF